MDKEYNRLRACRAFPRRGRTRGRTRGRNHGLDNPATDRAEALKNGGHDQGPGRPQVDERRAAGCMLAFHNPERRRPAKPRLQVRDGAGAPGPHVGLRRCDGSDRRVCGAFREIVAPEHPALTWAWHGAEGGLGHETPVTLGFAEPGERTEVTSHHAVFESARTYDLHRAGRTANLDRLAGCSAEAAAA